MTRSHKSGLVVLALLAVTVLFRLWLLPDHRVSFDSDEAIVGLMARHILAGHPIPTFYYGQAYMGSLDALLVAGGFWLLGTSITALRLVQLALALIGLLTAYALARAVTRRTRTALITLLLLAIPPALGALYTTISLGGYNELLILSNLVLLFGWQVTVEKRAEAWRWAALGLAAGVGWWVNGAIVSACAVVVLLGLRRSTLARGPQIALAAISFLIGSAPWWLYNVQHDWAALDFLLGGFESGGTVDAIPPGETLLGLILLGLPALYGLRYPWVSTFPISAAWIAAALVYLGLITDVLARGYGRLRYRRVIGSARERQAARWVVLVFAVFALIFTLSSFSDATGRYLLPLWVPAMIGVALGIERLRRASAAAALIALAVLLAFQASSVIRATDPGLTPQLVERLRTPPAADRALLDFLAEQGYTRGYASYWTSFRLIFRAEERVILATMLPYDNSGFLPGEDRYPAYTDPVAAAEQIVWITQNFPDLDRLIAARLNAAGITYTQRDFGPYRVYYDFSAQISPAELGIDWAQPVTDLLGE